jgi:queuine tRNA-ribosyltransferase
MIEFKIIKKSKKSAARVGILKTPHGEIETPSFVTVATLANAKMFAAEDLAAVKTPIVISNTFHLHLRPGEDIVKKAGGLHKFMNWNRPIMTDSGGFQVFSLGFGHDQGTSKIPNRKEKPTVRTGAQPQRLKINDNGVEFTSPIDGRKIFMGPRESIRIQEKLGADIILAFDECTPPSANKEYIAKSLEKTHAWAKICLAEKKSDQALYGIVQGSRFRDLRIKSAKFIGGLPFDGFGIGGEFGAEKDEMTRMLKWVFAELPEAKPRHLLGIGHPDDILPTVTAGVDTFDCIAPTHYGRRGTAFTSEGKIDLDKAMYLKQLRPLDKKCQCRVCAGYTRSYLCHLIKARELTGLKMVSEHNLFWMNTQVENYRQMIKEGKL